VGDSESDGDAEGKVPTFCCAVDVPQLDRGESGTSPEPARGRQHLNSEPHHPLLRLTQNSRWEVR